MAQCIAPPGTVLHRLALPCTAWHSMAPPSTAHCIALPGTALHRLALHCTAWHCIALHCTALHCIAPPGTALHCRALHCTAWHCIAPGCGWHALSNADYVSACACCSVQCMCTNHMCYCYKVAHSGMSMCIGMVWLRGIEFRVQGRGAVQCELATLQVYVYAEL